MLTPEDADKEIKSFPPAGMTKPFTSMEIHKAAKIMKNGKSHGIDQLNAENI